MKEKLKKLFAVKPKNKTKDFYTHLDEILEKRDAVLLKAIDELREQQDPPPEPEDIIISVDSGYLESPYFNGKTQPQDDPTPEKSEQPPTQEKSEKPQTTSNDAKAEETQPPDDDIETRVRLSMDSELEKFEREATGIKEGEDTFNWEENMYGLIKDAGISKEGMPTPDTNDDFKKAYKQATLNDLVHWVEDLAHKGDYYVLNNASEHLKTRWEVFLFNLNISTEQIKSVMRAKTLIIDKLKLENKEYRIHGSMPQRIANIEKRRIEGKLDEDITDQNLGDINLIELPPDFPLTRPEVVDLADEVDRRIKMNLNTKTPEELAKKHKTFVASPLQSYLNVIAKRNPKYQSKIIGNLLRKHFYQKYGF